MELLLKETPCVLLNSDDFDGLNVYSKLEFTNPTGSVKDRAANYVLTKISKEKIINKDTLIIESSSGNYGIALAAKCKELGLKFMCIIDPHITKANECLLNLYEAQTYMVKEPDENGGFLISRIKKVNEILNEVENSYWINQYSNPLNYEGYEKSIGKEICDSFDSLDYAFFGVSSAGTITGISRALKNKFPNVKVIAVDIDGSVVFGGHPKKRFIPGIGSSMVPDNLKNAYIDDVVSVNELESVMGCYELLQNNLIFAGGSSGSVYYAIQKYFSEHEYKPGSNVVTLFADRGERYLDTIYNSAWVKNKLSDQEIRMRRVRNVIY